MPQSHSINQLVSPETIRRQFPALSGATVFLENAGGSQVPRVVADAIRDYMLNTYVQLGAGYELANRCDEIIDRAHEFIALFMNGRETGTVIFGPSSSQLSLNLSMCYAGVLRAGDEVIVTEAGHEANIGPWLALADRGVNIRTWKLDPQSFECPLDSLSDLLNERTKLVACVHVSNLLGGIVDVGQVARRAHEVGARVVVDGVAYAPHRAIDVAAWDVDWYLYSTYKVYGPHMAVLYGKHEAVAELTGLNHFFVPDDEIPYKFEVGGVNHENCAGLLALGEYLSFVAGFDPDAAISRETIVEAFATMTAQELPLQRRLLEYLGSKEGVRIIGPAHSDEHRVGTISFVHHRLPASQIVAAAHRHNIGVRNGHMYAYRLCEALGLDPEDGVVRASLVHYNTLEEIELLITVLENCFSG